MGAEPKMVLVRPHAVLEHENQLVLGAVKRAHAGVALDPDAEVLLLQAVLRGGLAELSAVPPFHAQIENRAVNQYRPDRRDRGVQKRHELRSRHLASPHSELTMAGLAQPRHEAVDWDIIRWVAKHACHRLTGGKAADEGGITCIATANRVRAEMEDIAHLRYRCTSRRRDLVDRLLFHDRGGQSLDRQGHVDLNRIETGEIKLEACADQVLELTAKPGVVPDCVLTDTVEGKTERANLSLGAVLQVHDGDLVMTERDQGLEHRMAIDQRAGDSVHGQRHDLAKATQDGLQLAALRATVLARSMGRRLDGRRGEIDNLHGVLKHHAGHHQARDGLAATAIAA
jgi:hypothetical protein